ncbi:MAG: bacterio-opsin activator domain-containing protein [Halodesulfurarchaeum sp.]
MARTDRELVDVETKERAMDEAPIGITITDPHLEDNPLVYINDAFERITGYDRERVRGQNCRFLQGEDTDPEAVATLRSGIEAREPVTVELLNYTTDGDPFWNEVTVAPIRDESGDVTNYVGFQVDVTERKEAQQALAAERERLDRLVDRINGLLADITDRLMHGVDRAETEEAIVERIASTDPYAAAWVGEPDLAREELVTSTAAGFEDSVDDLAVDLAGDSPISQAFTEQAVVLGDPGDVAAFGPDASFDQLAAVPIAYGDASYGVLAVLGTDTDAIDDRELVVLESVGQTIATGINAAQSRRGLTADDLVELEFTVEDPTFFPAALADAWGAGLALRDSSASGDRGLRLFIDVEGGPEELEESVPDLEGVESVTRVGRGQPALVEIDLGPRSVIDRLAERGAVVRTLTAEPGVVELEVAVPAETGGRVILEMLEDRFDGVELVAYRERERQPTTRSALLSGLEAELTDRQATALRSAFYAGYYDEPRTASGDELAEAMGVSRQTFHQHLRAAERKLLAAVLD